MVKRYSREVGIGSQDLSTGAASGMLSLSDRLTQFARSTDQLTQAIGERRGSEQGSQVELEKDEKGITKAPTKRKHSVADVLLTGGATTTAYNQAVSDGYYASLENDIRGKLGELENTNRDSLTKFNEEAESLKSGLLKGVDPVARGATQRFLEAQIGSAQLRVQERTLNRHRDEAAATRLAAADAAGIDAARAARAGDVTGSDNAMLDAYAHIDSLVSTGDIASDVAADQKRKLTREANEQSYRYVIDKTLATKGLNEAFSDLDKLKKTIPKGWTPDEWDSFTGSVESDLSSLAAQQQLDSSKIDLDTAREISNLTIQAKTNTGIPSEIIKRTDELFNAGKIKPAARTSIMTAVINGQKDAVETAGRLAAVSKRLNGDVSAQVDQKAVDKAWEVGFDAPVRGLEQYGDRNVAIEEFINSVKIIPTSVKDRISAGIDSMDTDLVIESADLMDRIDSVRGIPNNSFTPNERAFAEKVVLLSKNLAPQEAIELAKKNTDPNDKARIDLRRQELKDEKYKYSNMAEKHYNPWFGSTKIDDINKGVLTKEYKTLFEEHYVAGMSESQANKKAAQMLARNWGVSEVTEKSRVMRNPPEHYYALDGDVSYIGRQLYSDVIESGVNIFSDEITLKDIYLTSDSITDRTATAGKPRYIVQVMTQSSGLITLPEYWVPDVAAEVEAQKTRSKEEVKMMREKQRPPPSLPVGYPEPLTW